MLHFQIDSHSGVPVYRQLMDQIRYYVAGGALKPGDQLPSIRELAQALTVNPTTIVKAYTELEHDRVIEMQHGRGAFIATAAKRVGAVEWEKALRRLARQLAVESAQMGADRSEVIRVLQEELDVVQERTSEEGVPIRIGVTSRR